MQHLLHPEKSTKEAEQCSVCSRDPFIPYNFSTYLHHLTKNAPKTGVSTYFDLRKNHTSSFASPLSIFFNFFSVEFGNLEPTNRVVSRFASLHRFCRFPPWPFVAVEERDPVPCGLTPDFSMGG